MKFGRTLRERISEEWAPHSVDYKGMKKALKGKASIPEKSGTGGSSGGGESAEARTEAVDREAFFRTYNRSKDKIRRFYVERESWAKDRVEDIGNRVEALKMSPPSSWSSSALVQLNTSITHLRHELDTLLEFFSLNLTGFSKILKKFDKCTGSCIREEEMAALKRTHSFLEGAALSDLKERLALMEAEISQLQKVKEELTIGRRPFAAGQRQSRPRVKTRELLHFEKCQLYLNRVTLDSPFFNNNSTRVIPHFQQEEIKASQLLGHGEFNNVREIEEFRVSESCHICFLHQVGSGAYQDAGESSESNETSQRSAMVSPALKSDREEMDHPQEQQASIDRINTGSSLQGNQIIGSISAEHFDTNVPSGRSINNEIAISHVDEISDYNETDSDHEEEEEQETRGFMKDHCKRDGSARYAIKQLREDLKLETKEDAALDLAMEAKFLAVLVHPNIIKMRGTVGLAGSFKFSIILDRLNCILSEKSREWAELEKQLRGFMGIKKKKKKNKIRLQGLWMDRFLALYDVARAMRYLHQHNIVFRDLKPDNIGFDIRGDAKVFDFGLAKELKLRDQVGPDKYKATGLTGTRRYMAPEVVLCKSYGLSADVFSFGILLWEIMALQTPFLDYSPDKHAEHVVMKGQRPKVPSWWPAVFKKVVKECWSCSPSERPPFSEICNLMKVVLSDHEKGLTLTDRTKQLMDVSITSRIGQDAL